MLWRIRQYFHESIWDVNIASLPPLSRVGLQGLRILVAAGWGFSRKGLSIRAGNLVYTTLLSLIPFLAVMFSVLKAFGVHQQMEPFLLQTLEPLGPRAVEITDRVVQFVNNLKISILGGVGLVGLFYTTYSLIDKIEHTFNEIWSVRSGRPFTRKITDYLSAVLVGPVLVFTAFALTASAQNYWLVERVLEIQPLGHLVVFLAQLMPVVFLSAAFTFLYKFLPNTQVPLSSALVGGVIGGMAWQLAGWGFAAFVTGSGRYGAIYSSFAVLILFLIWLYVGWVIVLTGAQLAFLHQHPPQRVPWGQTTQTDSWVFREWVALTMLVDITKRYLQGDRPYHPHQLSTRLKVPLSFLEDIIDQFVAHHLLCRTAEPPDSITLVRSPSTMSVWDVLAIMRDQQEMARAVRGEGKHDPVSTILRHRDRTVRGALDDVTVEFLAKVEAGEVLEEKLRNHFLQITEAKPR